MRIQKGLFEKGKLLREEETGDPEGVFGTGGVYRKLLYEEHGLDLKVVILQLEPGGRIPLHLEYNDEIFLVHSGKMTTWDQTEEHTLSAGEATLTLAGEGHAMRNDTDEDLVVIVIYSGETHHPGTLLE